ncbi:glycerophosphodiester phosphodiesterase family protein [Hymenobacter jeollabukensis]|uniref:Glycerophosphodiester phosphodiesterase n=1 Tax=Hymenobacter jeollabukensis TaxID=2025313 RepID=A0A5R8WTL9_9BACT|nr:glycerophosphodiester phosphodiesterase family protein [Hymenobacter jeollabukensis]TLM95107.1 glycerophosphodiester phosphodiesterase [Hymenobacter jeollabukensis]
MLPAPESSLRPLIYGHRGCRGLRPENTLPAFLHALDWGVDGLELDVIISADNEVVVSHEPWLNAAVCTGPDGAVLTPEAGRAFNLFRQPYATIRRCDCGRIRHPNFPEQQSEPAYKPTLTEVLHAVAARCATLGRPIPAFSIELKSTPGADGLDQPPPSQFVALVEQVLANAQRQLTFPLRLLLMSFDHRVVQAVRATSGYPVCLLIEDELPVAEHIQRLGFVPDALGPDYHLLDETLLRFCKSARLPIIAWTVNDPADIKRVAQLGVHGITTDYPDRAVTVLGP